MTEKVEELQEKLRRYEQNGAAKLYYSLNRKMNEMADMLNAQNLTGLDLADAKDKRFERLKSVWTDAESIAKAVDALGKLAKVTGVEDDDVSKKPFRQLTTSETIANVLENNGRLDA